MPDVDFLATAEGVESFLGSVFNTTKAEYKKKGSVGLRAFIFANPRLRFVTYDLLVEDKTCAVQVPQTIADRYDTPEYAEYVRESAKQMLAVGVLMLCESWMVCGKDLDSLKSVRPSEREDRKTVLMVTLDHKAFPTQRAWMCGVEDGDDFEEIMAPIGGNLSKLIERPAMQIN